MSHKDCFLSCQVISHILMVKQILNKISLTNVSLFARKALLWKSFFVLSYQKSLKSFSLLLENCFMVKHLICRLHKYFSAKLLKPINPMYLININNQCLLFWIFDSNALLFIYYFIILRFLLPIFTNVYKYHYCLLTYYYSFNLLYYNHKRFTLMPAIIGGQLVINYSLESIITPRSAIPISHLYLQWCILFTESSIPCLNIFRVSHMCLPLHYLSNTVLCLVG